MPRHKACPRRLLVCRLLTIALLLSLPAVLARCTMPHLTRVSHQSFPMPQSCSECHVEIHQEWAASPHAQAFSNPRFQQATDNYRFTECLGCHAPEPQLVTTTPAVRVSERELGVTCVSCHLDDGAMVGPLPPTGIAKPHPIRVDPAPFDNGRLCGHCHQGTLAQWRGSPLGERRQCSDCHMPAVTRKMTQSTSLISKPIVAAEKPEVQHRHSFLLTPSELPESAVDIELERDSKGLHLRLTNRLPHNLPTGDFGVRIVHVTAHALVRDGAEQPAGAWELTNAGGWLASGASTSWSLELPPGTRAVRVRGTRRGRDNANEAVLFEREVPLP